METVTPFGTLLRRLRKAQDLSQEALALRAFCALDTVKKIESGRRRPSRQLADQLADVLGLEATARAHFLAVARPAEVDADETGADDLGERAVALAAPHRPLPRQVTPFIGRVRELAALLDVLAQPDARLVTIVAPGGMGKTRLALTAAERVRDAASFPSGVAFASLGPVAAPAGLDPAIADALGLPLDPAGTRSPRAQLLDYLRAKALLLVLDNCEHLLDSVTELASAIRAEAPAVIVLATSRERLGLRTERLFPLDGMVTEIDGAALFAATSQAVQPTFALDETTRPQVAAICAQVGGMPLAIELAAGWADTLSLDEIAAELARGDELLTSTASDLPARHRSVRAVWGTTWARLSAEERAVFSQVAVFRGGGTRRALQAVTGASLGQLHALVGKALLRYDPERERYAVHELLRQYAAERLAEDASAERGAQERHATYYLSAMAEREVALKGAGQRVALDVIGKEIENVRAAWQWAAEAGDLGLLAPAVGALSLAYEWLGRSEDGLAAMRMAASAVAAVAPTAPGELLAVLLAAQARFAFLLGDASGTAGLLLQAQVLLDGQSGATIDAACAQVLLQLGHCAASQDFAAAHDAYSRSQALFETVGDQWGVATALAGLGWIAIELSTNYVLARQLLEQSVARYRAFGEQIGLGETLTKLSNAARYLGHIPESLALAREAYALAQASGNPHLIARSASNLGIALYWTTAKEEAYTTLRMALAITLEFSFQAELPNAYYRLGNAARGLGRYAEARVAYTRGLAAAQRLDDRLNICFILEGLSTVALAEGALAEALRLVEEAIATSIRLGEGQNQRLALRTGALAARHLGDVQRAEGYVVRGLRLALATRQWSACLGAAALLLADRGAPEYVAALFDYAGWTHLVKGDMWHEDMQMRELGAVVAALPPDVAAAARARWEGRDYWEALAELLAELEAEGWGSER